MNEERELLRRISSHSGSVIPTQFIYEIQELLAQPDYTEPSSLAFKIANAIADQFEVGFCNDRMVEHFAEEIDKHLPKREPLSNKEVIAKYKDIILNNPLYVPSYYAGFRDAEQAHGITGGEE
jgi:hypothetical protein